MTREPCPGCPFAGCAGCAYQGTPPVDGAGRNDTHVSYDGRTTETAPAGALTPVAPGPRPSDQTGGLAQ